MFARGREWSCLENRRNPIQAPVSKSANRTSTTNALSYAIVMTEAMATVCYSGYAVGSGIRSLGTGGRRSSCGMKVLSGPLHSLSFGLCKLPFL